MQKREKESPSREGWGREKTTVKTVRRRTLKGSTKKLEQGLRTKKEIINPSEKERKR